MKPSCRAEASKDLDPRVRRTRKMLQDALAQLLKEKEFDKISIGDIAEASTLNRATFYGHYPDKFALLESLVATQFEELIAKRNICFLDGFAQHPPQSGMPVEILSSTVAWAIYGAAKEWVQSPKRMPVLKIGETIEKMIMPILLS